MDWVETTINAHYETLTALQRLLEEGDTEAVRRGLESLRNDYLTNVWDASLQQAIREAKREMGIPVADAYLLAHAEISPVQDWLEQWKTLAEAVSRAWPDERSDYDVIL
jgi:hypothetical protein